MVRDANQLYNPQQPSVLVIDEVAVVRSLIRSCLEIEGWQVVEAATGGQAREASLGRPIDLVLCDICLDASSVDELLADLRAQHPQVPIILMSGVADPQTLERVAFLGGVSFLPKPFDPGLLVDTLDAARGAPKLRFG